MKTPTRADYLEGRATFAEYYRAVNHSAGIRVTNADFLARVRKALAEGDEHLNTIPLAEWDKLAVYGRRALSRAFKEHGDFYSMAGGVCAYKQAARDAVDDHSAPTWENQVWHARKLLAEHGRDALNNPHAMIGRTCGCGACFCCAALAVVKEHDAKPRTPISTVGLA